LYSTDKSDLIRLFFGAVNIIIICYYKIFLCWINLFLRLFHIAVVAAYFFCSYAGIIGAPYISTLGDRAFTPFNCTFPASTYIVTPALSKHIYTHCQIKIESNNPEVRVNNTIPRLLPYYYFISSEGSPFKISLESPLNKAPPLFFS